VRKTIITFIIEKLAKLVGQDIPPFSTVGAIVINKGKLLMVNLSYKKGYNLPGGLVAPGETLEQGLARELKEETNLDAESMQYFSSATESKGNYYTLVSGFVVKVKDIDKLRGSDEGKLEWMNSKDAYNRCVYSDSKELIRTYFNLK